MSEDTRIQTAKGLDRSSSETELRDQFAEAALTGLLSRSANHTLWLSNGDFRISVASGYAKAAYILSDAMWEARFD